MKGDRAGHLLTTDCDVGSPDTTQAGAQRRVYVGLTRHKYKAWLRSALQRVYAGFANRRRGLMAATPPGSGSSSAASIPMVSSRRPSRCRRGKRVRLRLKTHSP
jgi:hypothetical protein